MHQNLYVRFGERVQNAVKFQKAVAATISILAEASLHDDS